jgi:hypothetical protein
MDAMATARRTNSKSIASDKVRPLHNEEQSKLREKTLLESAQIRPRDSIEKALAKECV